MTKARELLETGPEKITLSSGVTVRVAPFPAELWSDLNAKAWKEFPDPDPPKKVIKVVDGTEEVDDEADPSYVKAKKEARKARNNLLGDAIFDLSVEVDLDQYTGQLKRLERYTDLPEDPDDLRIAFLKKYALRTIRDWEAVTVSAVSQMMVSDPEVAERLKFFRREVERAAAADADAPGAAEGERVEVLAEAEGA